MGPKERQESQRGGAGISMIPALVPLLFAASPALAGPIAWPAPDVVSMTVAGAVVVAAVFWGAWEHKRAVSLRRFLRASTAKARTLLSARDAWLAAGRESLLIWSPEPAKRLSFAGGRELLEECLAGPDAPLLSAALEGLSGHGVPFTLTCRTLERNIAVRGRPAGGYLLVFLEAQAQDAGPTLDFRSALDAI